MKFNHIENVTVEATFSDCGRYRYCLRVKKNDASGNKKVCVIMQNPSVANSEVADRSVQFLEKLIFLKGYSEFNDVNEIVIVNQFAYVQTNDFSGSSIHIGPENDSYIKSAVESSDIVLVAWGSGNGYNERKMAINAIISAAKNKTLLQTKAHPSRGTYVDFVTPYSN
ncbi:DUF1643 domain-containing protein [Marinobacter sp. F4216]|uniref:DUF1643 domain-containing protein n=1 Tax=Marinobacter sp. F4216 TaxID=2874281 RepID=UPI001CBDC8FE|nr:DUF1643 domain-containing protein [Marinobacter sp. F4216]MBZ2169460.1 DUF1643 domain-containing protein [Marinobacter sp. F4216]